MALSTVPYVLIVDDEVIIRMHTCEILQDAGFRCYEAETGDEAITIVDASGESITLLFTDVDMPGETNGFALARYVAERWPEIEIVVCSGRVRPEDGDMPDRATFIGKPFDEHVVHDHLRRNLPDGKKPEPLKTAV